MTLKEPFYNPSLVVKTLIEYKHYQVQKVYKRTYLILVCNIVTGKSYNIANEM